MHELKALIWIEISRPAQSTGLVGNTDDVLWVFTGFISVAAQSLQESLKHT